MFKITRKSNLRHLNCILAVFILFCIVLAFVIHESSQLHKNDIPRGDEAAFLETAISIREHGGPLALIPRMFSGEYREANRHPLYVFFLSTFAKRELSFYARAKVFTSFLALVYLLLIFHLMHRLLGINPSLLITILLATNHYFLEHSAKISTEPIFMIFVLFSWYLITKNFYKSHNESLKQGGLSALAYLSKVTGIFIILAYFASALIIRKRYFISKNLLYFTFGFFIVALPLLWRNTRVYGNPIYNYNSKLLWIESATGRRSVSLFEGDGQNFHSFIRKQSLAGLGKRVVDGLAGEAVVITQAVSFSYARIRGALLVALLFFIALYKEKKKERALFSAFLISVFYLFFSWYYKISGHYRYILPIVFIFYFYIVGISYSFLKKIFLGFIEKQTFSLLFKFTLLLISLFVLLRDYKTLGFASPLKAVYPRPEYLEVKDWITKNITDELYFNGPGHEYQVEWLTGTSHLSFEIPATDDFPGLTKFIKNWGIKYVILSEPVIVGRKEILGKFFGEEYVRGIYSIKDPPGWELILEDPGEKTRYLIYKISSDEN